MEILWTIIIGFIVGLIARAVMPGDDSAGIVLTTILGIAGAFLGSFIAQTFGWGTPGEPAGFFASLMGAILILFIIGVFRPKTAHHQAS